LKGRITKGKQMTSLSFYRGDNREIVNSRASLHQLSVMKPVGRALIFFIGYMNF